MELQGLEVKFVRNLWGKVECILCILECMRKLHILRMHLQFNISINYDKTWKCLQQISLK